MFSSYPQAERCFPAGALAKTATNGQKALGKQSFRRVPDESGTFSVIYKRFGHLRCPKTSFRLLEMSNAWEKTEKDNPEKLSLGKNTIENARFPGPHRQNAVFRLAPWRKRRRTAKNHSENGLCVKLLSKTERFLVFFNRFGHLRCPKTSFPVPKMSIVSKNRAYLTPKSYFLCRKHHWKRQKFPRHMPRNQ